ncbi:MAG: phosphoribosylformylglycinamidine cyclo-ligase [Syntrophobacterales bacterium]|nr:MAG: phosphoribosylformylglycinamidine cyclo-ligase [Syntrophobacterales bacterium]
MAMLYKDAGVDVDLGEEFVRRIKSLAESTFGPRVLTKLGGFTARYSLEGLRDTVLVASTDGVGTKLKVAFMVDRHDTVGIDLVAMCVNDILVSGAQPLFFMDYIATGKLDLGKAVSVIEGIVKGCKEAGCSLIGGETAEMPGFYVNGEYDLVGFIVGIANKTEMIDGSEICPGDRLIGLASSGLHSNGFSLVRKIVFDQLNLRVDDWVEELGRTIGEELLEPTRIYVNPVLTLKQEFHLRGVAHITGGGIKGNLPRILPRNCKAFLRKGSWQAPPVFSFLEREGRIPEEEMWRTFNNGIGMILIIKAEEVEGVLIRLRELGEGAFLIGEISEAKGEGERVEFI